MVGKRLGKQNAQRRRRRRARSIQVTLRSARSRSYRTARSARRPELAMIFLSASGICSRGVGSEPMFRLSPELASDRSTCATSSSISPVIARFASRLLLSGAISNWSSSPTGTPPASRGEREARPLVAAFRRDPAARCSGDQTRRAAGRRRNGCPSRRPQAKGDLHDPVDSCTASSGASKSRSSVVSERRSMSKNGLCAASLRVTVGIFELDRRLVFGLRIGPQMHMLRVLAQAHVVQRHLAAHEKCPTGTSGCRNNRGPLRRKADR